MSTRLRDFGILIGVCVWCVCAECFLAVCQCKCVPNVTWQYVSVSVCVCERGNENPSLHPPLSLISLFRLETGLLQLPGLVPSQAPLAGRGAVTVAAGGA